MRSLLSLSLAAVLTASTASAFQASTRTDDLAAGQVLELSGAGLRFAAVETAASLLGTEDTFVRLQSPFDRQLRMASTTPVAVEDYLAFAAGQARAWTAAERALVADAVRIVREGIDEQGIVLPLPGHVDLVKSTGREEIDACGYTRESFVVLNARCLRGGGEEATRRLAELLSHELFHIMTRHEPGLRDDLYAAIGFHPLDVRFEPPPEVADLRLTNPDAPVVEHAITLELDGVADRFVPVLYSPREYDGGPFFSYLDPMLLRITDDGRPARTPAGTLDLTAYDDVPEFFELVGRNTGYIIHPEEILADNASLLILGRRDSVPSPGVLEAMLHILARPTPRTDPGGCISQHRRAAWWPRSSTA